MIPIIEGPGRAGTSGPGPWARGHQTPGKTDGGRGPANVGTQLDIEKAELFRSVSPQRLARVGPLLHERRFERSEVLYFEGNPADRVWVVASGEVRLYKSSPGGQITTLDVLRPGEIFGGLSVLPDEVYPTGAEAVTAGSAWWLGRKHFLRLLEEEPDLSLEILQIVSGRLRAAHDRLRSFAHDPAPVRLARALLDATQEGEARVTRRALAEAAGTTVETAIRVLRRFERAGLLRGEVGHIHLQDESTLGKIARGESL